MSTTSPLIGITAEWNPFHAGHSVMIDIIKKAYPEASLIAIMSGAFVQRGEPALFDKWTRARWAVRSGVDAVFEFPALYALQSADRFSCHAASMLHAM
uniref:nucleotidyltransferase family protein n=1 Tax=Dialister sp. TaxID=1955814 RepID=UPI004025F65C